MLKRVLYAAALIIIILVLAILGVYNAKSILFYSFRWLIVGAVVLGTASGIYRGIFYNIAMQRPGQPDRHNIDSFLEHWGTAAGIFILIVSGFTARADYSRIFSFNLHFIGLIATLYFGTYFLAHFLVSKKYIYLIPNTRDIIDGIVKRYLFRAVWNDAGKYLSSQKLAFLGFALLGAGILVTGAIKVAGYYFGVPMQLTQTATQVHDLLAGLFVLMLITHILFALIVRSHRRLLKSMFTGKK